MSMRSPILDDLSRPRTIIDRAGAHAIGVLVGHPLHNHRSCICGNVKPFCNLQRSEVARTRKTPGEINVDHHARTTDSN